MYSRILDLLPGASGKFFQVPQNGHFPECDVIRGGMYSRILDLPPVRGIRHVTCQNLRMRTGEMRNGGSQKLNGDRQEGGRRKKAGPKKLREIEREVKREEVRPRKIIESESRRQRQ